MVTFYLNYSFVECYFEHVNNDLDGHFKVTYEYMKSISDYFVGMMTSRLPVDIYIMQDITPPKAD